MSSTSSLDSSLLISLLQFGSGTTADYAREVAAHARTHAQSEAAEGGVSGDSSFYASTTTDDNHFRGPWGGLRTGSLEHYPSLASSTSSLSPEMRHRRNDLRRQLENQTTNLSGLRDRLQREMQEDTEDKWLKQHKKQTNGRFDGAQRRELRRFFRALDIDSSGEISIAELESPLLTTGVVSSMKELEDLVKKIDYDHSGEIDLQEFMAAFKPASKSKALKMNREEATTFHEIKMSQLWKDDANPNIKKVKRKGGEHEGTVYKTLHSNKAIAAEKAAERGEAAEATTHPAVAALLMGGGSLLDDEDEKKHAEATFSAFDELLKVLEGRTLDVAQDGEEGETNSSTKTRKSEEKNVDPIFKLKKEPPVYVLRSQHLNGAGSPKVNSHKISSTMKSSLPLRRGKSSHLRSLSPTRRGKNVGGLGSSITSTISSPPQLSLSRSSSTTAKVSTPVARSMSPSPRNGDGEKAISPSTNLQDIIMTDLRLSQRSSLASRQSEQGGVLKRYSIDGLGSGDGGGGGGTKSLVNSMTTFEIKKSEFEGQSTSSPAQRGIPKHVLVAGAAKLSLQTRLAAHRRHFVLNLITNERDKYLTKRNLVSEEMKLSFQRGDETRGGILRQILRHVDTHFQKMMDRMKALMNVITSELDRDVNANEEEREVEEVEEENLDGDDIMEIGREREGESHIEFKEEDASSSQISLPVFSNSSRLLKNCKYRLRIQELRAEGMGVEQAAKIAMEEGGIEGLE